MSQWTGAPMTRFAKLVKVVDRSRLATTLLALWKLFKHPDTPWAPKLVAVAVLAYVVSPIDLIPDFIPLIGMLDDIVLVPLGVALAVRLTPAHLWQARLAEAETSPDRLPTLVWGAVVVVLIWLLSFAGFVWWLWTVWNRSGNPV
jgi:uncharacterized membrane protein YkvA (DUF1232 family)